MVVMELNIRGVPVRIMDDAYRDASPEELKRRREEARRIAGRMIAEQRRKEEEAHSTPSHKEE